MSKFSVKKPFTVLVMVIVMLILGGVSLTRMQLDLLPEISLPYLLVVTTYPGASPEKIETTVAEPMESTLGTVNGVKNIYSNSYENYCMVQMEFEDDTDIDSVLVKVSTAVNSVAAILPEECGTPSIIELSTDMMASQYLAVSYEGMDMEELSTFVSNNITPAFERIEGVASVTTMGLIEESVQVELNEAKVDDLNLKILAKANKALDEAMEKLDEAKEQMEDGEKSLADGKKELRDNQKKLDDGKKDLEDGKKELEDGKKELEDGKRQLEDGKLEMEQKLAETETQLLTAKADLEASKMHITLQIAPLQLAGNEMKGKLEEFDAAKNKADAPIEEGGLKARLNQVITDKAISILEQDELAPQSGSEGYDAALEIAKAGITWDTIKADEGNKQLVEELNQYISDSYVPTLEIADTDIQTAVDSKLDAAVAGYSTQYEILKQADDLNSQMLSQYESGLEEIDANTKMLDDGLTQLYAGNLEAAIQMANASTALTLGEMQMKTAEATIESTESQLESAQKQIDAGWDQLKDAEKQLQDGWDSYNDALENFEKQKAEAIRNANADQLISLSALTGIIYAQNFSMPAGYIDDKDDNSWLLKVGDEFESLDELKDLVLVDIEDVGEIKLGDVADLTIIDNTGTDYTKLDGERGVILSLFKGSTAGTNAVSRLARAKIAELEEKYPELSIEILMDQGDFINMIVKNVVESMLIGAALAVIILAFFLKDIMPTIVVAISIPLSVLTALIAMYFANISLNMMSLSGMALGIGMLVDNSIVVIENIYRLRGRNVGAPRAAVQGTKQVAGAVIASTLTTVCVFFPMVYTTGLVRELMLPMSLTIIFTLLASLLIAMTVVPAAASTLLRKTKPKEHKLFDKIQDIYGEILGFFLKVKIIPIAVSIGLLALSVWQAAKMGIVIIPDMTSNQIEGSVTFPDEIQREDAYEQMDILLDRFTAVPGVKSVGVFAGNSSNLMVSSSTGESSFTRYSLMVLTENEDAGSEEVREICKNMEAAVEGTDAKISLSSGMGEMSSMLGSGLSLNIYGDDNDTLLKISQDVMDIVGQVEGFTNINNGQEDADQVLHLYIDRNKAMLNGLTVAQMYQEIAEKLTTSANAVSVNIDGKTLDVKIVNEIHTLSYEDILNYNFAVKKTDSDGSSYTEDLPLSDVAELVVEDGVTEITRKNQSNFITVSASVEEGYNSTLLTRELQPLLDKYEMPSGYQIETGGEYETVQTMVKDMVLVMLLGVAFIYLVMVAQFQSLLSPFIVLFTIPLAFTGGFMSLWFTKENISIIAMMGFVVLLGTVVNNGIVFVDYTNQLRIGGMDRHAALIATGKTRMRPILMTALTTILAESSLIFGDDMGSQMGRGMALVIAGGLAYATLMTLFIIPVMYDILFKKPPVNVDLGSENLDDIPDDAQEFIQAALAKQAQLEADTEAEAENEVDAEVTNEAEATKAQESDDAKNNEA